MQKSCIFPVPLMEITVILFQQFPESSDLCKTSSNMAPNEATCMRNSKNHPKLLLSLPRMLSALPFSGPLNFLIASFYAPDLLHADILLHFKCYDCAITLQTAHPCLIKFGVEFNGDGT